MFSSFSESGIQGIEIQSTGQRWYLEEPEEVAAFVRWLNAHVAQQSVQRTVKHVSEIWCQCEDCKRGRKAGLRPRR